MANHLTQLTENHSLAQAMPHFAGKIKRLPKKLFGLFHLPPKQGNLSLVAQNAALTPYILHLTSNCECLPVIVLCLFQPPLSSRQLPQQEKAVALTCSILLLASYHQVRFEN